MMNRRDDKDPPHCVLVVSEDEELRDSLSARLSPACDIRMASGQEAVALLGAVRFDAFIAEVMHAEDGNPVKMTALPGADARARMSALSSRAALGTMTAALIHDLAGMVQGLQYGIAEIEYMVEDGGEIRAEDLRETVGSLSQVSERIINLFTAAAQKLKNQPSENLGCSLGRAVQHARVLCDAYVRGRARLKIASLPEIELEANESQILRVLTNLLRNAADASPRNGTIDVTFARVGDRVEIAVTDDGPGVPPELAGTMFEPFVKGKADDAGSGLGLAISAQVLNDCGGSITYSRAPQRGARFVVSLPIAQSDRRPLSSESRLPAA